MQSKKMNWFGKIKESISKKDISPELKKGEIKQILIRTANDILPDFKFLDYKNSCYTFQKLRQANGQTVYETFHIVFSLKDKYFACSIASRLNPQYIHVNFYNIGLINPHKDMTVLRFNTGALDVRDAYYYHNGQVETTTRVVREIFQDYKKYGVPFLDKQFERLNTNEIIKTGLGYISNLKADKETIKNEIEQELNQGRHHLSSIKHPLYLDLKEKLQSVSGQSREDRQLIPKATYELLEMFFNK